MKNIIIISIVFILTLFSTGCEKETEGISKITYFADFTMAGEDVIFHELGTPFDDPGATATESGQTLPVTISVTGTYFGYTGASVDVDHPDEYVVRYTAVNSDGFPGSTFRTVYVYSNGDLVNSIEGIYTSTIVRNGVASAQYEDLEYIIIKKVGANTYTISCAIGGYYAIGRGYGVNYLASGCVITANDIPSNDFSYTQFSVGAFGGVAEMSGMTVDPVAKTIYFESAWDAGYTFAITLTQVEL